MGLYVIPQFSSTMLFGLIPVARALAHGTKDASHQSLITIKPIVGGIPTRREKPCGMRQPAYKSVTLKPFKESHTSFPPTKTIMFQSR